MRSHIMAHSQPLVLVVLPRLLWVRGTCCFVSVPSENVRSLVLAWLFQLFSACLFRMCIYQTGWNTIDRTHSHLKSISKTHPIRSLRKRTKKKRKTKKNFLKKIRKTKRKIKKRKTKKRKRKEQKNEIQWSVMQALTDLWAPKLMDARVLAG